MSVRSRQWTAMLVVAGLLVTACSSTESASSTSASESTEPSTTSQQETTEPTLEPTPDSTTSTEPEAPPSPPSQDAGSAERDGVVPALAELPIALRVEPIESIASKEGRWVLSRPTAATLDLAPGCGLGDPEGVYGRDIICVVEYGEVLLMDADGSEILRAYPLPSLPPQHLVVTDDAVFCGRQGDGGLPDSMLCRIDRATLEWTVRVFPFSSASAFGADGEQAIPANWVIEEPMDAGYLDQMTATDDGLVVEGWSGRRLVDPITLELRSS